MNTRKTELSTLLTALNAGLREALASNDRLIRSQLNETLELLAQLNAMELAEMEWKQPIRRGHLTLIHSAQRPEFG